LLFIIENLQQLSSAVCRFPNLRAVPPPFPTIELFKEVFKIEDSATSSDEDCD